MGQIPDKKIERWMEAAGQTGKSSSVRDRVIKAGEFLERTARLDEASACECLTGIDFSKNVEVVGLPAKTYVQYVDKHKGAWFTDIGLTPDQVGLADGTRKRKLFVPIGAVPALKTTARAVKDAWTLDRIFESISPAAHGKLGQMTRGGGTQYLVFDKTAMKEI